MEAFSLLRYWKGGGGALITGGGGGGDPAAAASAAAFVASSVSPNRHSADEEDDADNDDLFDLEFAVPGDDDDEDSHVSKDDSDDGESESLHSADVFFNGRLLVPIDGSGNPSSETKASLSSHLPVSSLLNKSATKFRVFLLGFRKTKAEPSPSKNSKLFTIKFNVEEVSRSTKNPDAPDTGQPSASALDEHKRFSKEAVQKYLKKVKPLYVRVSKKINTDKPRSSIEKDGGALKKHLMISKSSSDVAANSIPAGAGGASSKRRDDSLLQQQDGIQSAILHCKRSFNASRDSESSQIATPGSDISVETLAESSSSMGGSDCEGTCK